MKINGQAIHVPFEMTHIIYRDPTNVEIKIRATPYNRDFEALCPEVPKKKRFEKGQFAGFIFDDPKYLAAVEARNTKRQDYMVIRCMDVEWERVDFNDPETWHNWRHEMEEAGFSDNECTMMVYACVNVHNPGQETVDAARENFLRTQGHRQTETDETPQVGDQPSIVSGEPVSDSE